MTSNKRTGADEDPVTRRLDVLISITLDQVGEGSMQIAAKIQRLSLLGLSAAEISRIVGKPKNYVTATQSQQRAARKGRK
jgi:hypothetical protein